MCHKAHYLAPRYVHSRHVAKDAYLLMYIHTHRTWPHNTLMARRKQMHRGVENMCQCTTHIEGYACLTTRHAIHILRNGWYPMATTEHTNYDIISHTERYQCSCSVFYSYDAT